MLSTNVKKLPPLRFLGFCFPDEAKFFRSTKQSSFFLFERLLTNSIPLPSHHDFRA